MEAVGYLADVDDDRIHPGMPARCILDTYPDRVFRGKVERSPPSRSKRGFRVRVSLECRIPPDASRDVGAARGLASHLAERPLRAAPGGPRERRQALRDPGGLVRSVEVRLAACTPTDCVVESA
jgi:hypothetical protein